MNKKNTSLTGKIIIFLGTFLGLLSKAGFAFALEVTSPTIFGISITSSSTLAEYSCYLFGLGTNLAILISVVAVVFGGVYYLISYGTGKFTDEGKNWIKAGLTGLLIIVCSYLIGQTINPNMTSCKVSVLSMVIPTSSPNGGNINQNLVGIDNKQYNEIPIGTLTENLLAGTDSCYEFNMNGDPIDYSTINSSATTITDDSGNKYSNSEWFIPEFVNHDRVDCLMKYAEAAQKKYQLLAEIADQTSKQISSCTGFKQAGLTNGGYCIPEYGCYYYWGGSQDPYLMSGMQLGYASFYSLFPYGGILAAGNPAFNSSYCTTFTQGVINGGPSVLVPDKKCINVPGAA